MTISIALATYNGERYLPELLSSLSSQSRLPDELVVGDDGSTDATLAIVKDFSRRAPFAVRLVVNDRRLGYGDNFLAVAAGSCGDIVAFCDQDDIWRQDKIEAIGSVFAGASNAVLACHYAEVVDQNGVPVGRQFPRAKLSRLYSPPALPLPHFPGFSIAVTSSVLAYMDRKDPQHAHDFRPRRLPHDVLAWMIAACLGDVVVLPHALVSYRQHENLYGDSYVEFGERVRRLLAADVATYEGQRSHWDDLARYLDGLAHQWRSESKCEWAANAEVRVARYRALSRQAAARAHIYNAETRRWAVARWASAYRSGSAWATDVNRSFWTPWKDLAAALKGNPPETRAGGR